MAQCALCGTETPTAAMEMTGHGWRCANCAARAELAIYRGEGGGMAEHLTRAELDQVVIAGRKQIVRGFGGIVLGAGGIALTVALFHSGRLLIMFCGVVLAGAATIGHGMFRKRMAAAAIRQAPDARLIVR